MAHDFKNAKFRARHCDLRQLSKGLCTSRGPEGSTEESSRLEQALSIKMKKVTFAFHHIPMKIAVQIMR